MKNVTYHVLPPRSSIETKRLHNNIQLRFKRHQINELLSKLLFTSSLKIPRCITRDTPREFPLENGRGKPSKPSKGTQKSPLNSERICCKERNSSFQYVKYNSFLFFFLAFASFSYFLIKRKGNVGYA